jgi:NADPH:quinone reductase-like Zn-dependent oxidoreductase
LNLKENRMKALVVNRNGTMDKVEKPLGALDPGKIRVRVEYAGVGFADAMAVRGGYFLAPSRPFSPGYEFLGTVEATGVRVAGMVPKMNCYQEFLDIDEVWAVVVPPSLSSATAAAMPLNYLTAVALIEAKAHLGPGDSFLIHGAAGGVGSAALEWARLKGLRAFGTVSAGKEPDVEALGATALRRGASWLTQARSLEPEGFRAAFDAFGGTLLRESYASLAPGGMLVSYGFAPTARGGSGPLVDGLLFHAGKRLFPGGRRTAVCGTPALVDHHRTWYRETLTSVLAKADEGLLNPRIHEILPWDQAETAHAMIHAGSVRGKILLKFS